ncbi:MAG: tetratricopeptide repeat protein, partial [Myxococcaceae bacterium]
LAQQAPDAWLAAETLVLQGTLKARQADAPNAEKVLRRALLEAQGAGHPLASARAAGQLGYVYGVLMGREAEADRAFEQAFALSSYVSDDALTARLLLIRATVYENLRDPQKALEDAERALALLKGRGAGSEHAQAAALNAMGRSAAATGKTDDALKYQRSALALLETSLGPNHPEVARALEALALVHLGRKETSQALPLLERSTAMRDSALGAEDPSFGSSLRVLCELYRTQRDWNKAEDCLARAVEVEEKRQSDASLVPALLELARVHEAQQKPQLALVGYQKAATLSERLMGTSQPTVATALRGMASAYLDLRQPEKARLALERSVMLVEPTGSDLELVVRLRVQLARVLKGPAARIMALKAREDASRCGAACASLMHELDGGAARTPIGPNLGGSRFPSRR